MAARTWTACRRAPASTTTAPAWRRCWRPRCSWAVRRRCATRCGSGSGVPRNWACSGPTSTSQSLDVDALKDIALYLNFDMLGSPNPGYFTYDGDQSTPPTRQRRAARAGGLGGHRAHAGGVPRRVRARPPEDTDFDGRSDYDAFTQAGVPAGGLFAGRRGEEDRRGGRAVGRTGRQAVRSELPQARRHHREHRPRPHSRSRAAESRTPWASTPRTRRAATACRCATTAPGTW